jgi:peptidoglycan/LPS O-acetylase OafA/YrhL
MKKKQVYFENLDAIRFIAAMMVFIGHAMTGAFNHLKFDNVFYLKTISLISNGGMGVSIFCVLSGFLITYLIITETEVNGKLNVKKFYIRRFLRIWPLYFFVVFFSFILYPGVKEIFDVNTKLGSNILFHISFLSNFDAMNIAQNCYGLDAISQNITWSVSIEEQFYLFWPLIFLLPKKIWIYVISLLLFLSISFRILNKDIPFVNYYHTLSVLVDLVIGGGFAYLVKHCKRIRALFEKSNTWSHLFLFLATILILSFGTESVLGSHSNSLGRIITSLLFALIIVSQSLTINKSILNLSNFKLGTTWGKYTYGIYLLHPIVITMVDVSFRIFKINYKHSFITEFSVGLLMLFLTLSISWLSYNYFELRFLKLKNRFQIIKSQK